MSAKPEPQPVVMLVGPTASGKSAAALQLAQVVPIEIITVDSAQVYRGMDVGTAKPTPGEQEQVPHHLVDLIDPVENYSAAQFASAAQQLIREIRQRDRYPVLVGGTMLYIKALTQGLNKLPAANPELRRELDTQAAKIGWPAMHQRLALLDPATADRLEPNDSQRIQRALEVIELSGQPMSTILAQPLPTNENPERFVTISLEPKERSLLHTKIAERFNNMIAQGLIDEVRGLFARDDLHPALPSMRCVGYRQIWQWLEAGEQSSELSLAIDAGIAATRQLAKRQLTWLRNNPDRQIIDSNSPEATARAVELAQRELHPS